MEKITGYADVNGLHLYHEVAGEGFPLVLLHGGMLTDLLLPMLSGFLGPEAP